MSVLIIAEAGVNHNGSLERALAMVDAAVDAGADIIKFQTFQAHLVVSQFAQKADYQKASTGADESQLEMIRKLQLTYEDHQKIADYCVTKNIEYLSTPFDFQSLDEVLSLDISTIKVPSGEITHYRLLKAIAEKNKDVILSTGMSELSEIQDALEVLAPVVANGKKITVLHCNTEYPTPYEDVNLRVIPELRNILKCDIGYSDHTPGIVVPIAAVALGATLIEKHFTLDKNLPGPDHQASLDPDELTQMVKGIRNIEKALGTSVKSITPSEKKNIHIARKYLVASKPISVGDFFDEQNVTAKRIGVQGINPMKWPVIVGTRSPHNFSVDEPIKLDD
ncbi:MAG: N-acetylneuraminate synthase [Chitinophagaceae bacterium]|nr:MAG: N-acetylneuraminate synthase [Chitinophagaceae bacterium]